MFDSQQLKCLRALLDVIIPEDDFPGAWEAGVGDYLRRQLAGDLAKLLPAYQTWLANLDDEARAVYGADFAGINPQQQAALLSRIEQGAVEAVWQIEPAPFFREIVEHCAEGYYSDPGNGGNRDGVAWRMIGFEVSG